MDISGKLIKKLKPEGGTSKAGKEWKKQTIIIDNGNDFNNLTAVSAFGDKIKQMDKLEVGMTVTILCNIYSREYNGKYYHNIDGYHFTNQSENPEINNDFIIPDDNNMPF